MNIKIFVIVLGIYLIHSFFGLIKEASKTVPAFFSGPKPASEETQTPSSKSLPNGFAKYRWGTEQKSLPAMTLDKQITDQQSLYKLKPAYPASLIGAYVGKSKPLNTYVMLLDNKLSSILFQLPDKAEKSIVSYLQANYGPAEKRQAANYTAYRWEDEKTVLALVVYKEQKYLLLQASSKVYLQKTQ